MFTNMGAMRKIRSTLKMSHSGDSDRGKGASAECDDSFYQKLRWGLCRAFISLPHGTLCSND